MPARVGIDSFGRDEVEKNADQHCNGIFHSEIRLVPIRRKYFNTKQLEAQ